MNNTFRKLSIALVALFAFASLAPAQALTLIPTTLSVAITDSATQVMTVASVSTVSGYTVAIGTVGYIDNEQVTVKSVSSLILGIIRGQGGTVAAAHASGALVFLGPPTAFASKTAFEPQGSCTRSKLPVVPFVNIRTGIISDCLGGNWVQGIRTAAPRFRVYSPEPGGTVYTSLNTTGTTLGATTLYCSEVNLPVNKLLTGAAVLAGTTVGTDKWYVVLYDASGNALANSALAGATTAGASTFQQQAFASKIYAVGPAQYFACFQTNGTTDTARMAITGVNDNVLTKGQTGATFGTVPALTVPTTFTTAVGPYVYLY